MARVLVIDDEPRIANFVSRALTAEGFRVDAASDGIRGLELARSGRYELVVLDILLPGRDGVSVLRDLMEVRPEQRVLILSALSDVQSKVECLELGASDYLPKPFALAELLARVRARLRQPASGPGGRFLRSGAVTLDLVRRTTQGRDGPVPLSEREFHAAPPDAEGGRGLLSATAPRGGVGVPLQPGEQRGGRLRRSAPSQVGGRGDRDGAKCRVSVQRSVGTGSRSPGARSRWRTSP